MGNNNNGLLYPTGGGGPPNSPFNRECSRNINPRTPNNRSYRPYCSTGGSNSNNSPLKRGEGRNKDYDHQYYKYSHSKNNNKDFKKVKRKDIETFNSNKYDPKNWGDIINNKYMLYTDIYLFHK